MALGDRYSKLLLDQPSFNDGTVGGGIANVIQQGLRGYMYGQEQEELAAQEALVDNVFQLLLRNNPATPATQMPMESGSPRYEAMSDAPIATGSPRFADDASPVATAPTQLAPSTRFAQVPGTPSDFDQALSMLSEGGQSDLAFNLLSQRRADEASEAAFADELVQVPNPIGDGSMIYARRGDITAGDIAAPAPALAPNPLFMNFTDGLGGIQTIDVSTGLGQATAAAAIQTRNTNLENQIGARQVVIDSQEGVIGTIDSAIASIENQTALSPVTGQAGVVARIIGGPAVTALDGYIDTIKANLGFDQLQAMRAASPTGGALGQVAVQELNALQATVASLDPLAGEDVILANLEKIKNHYNEWIRNARDANQQAEAIMRSNPMSPSEGAIAAPPADATAAPAPPDADSESDADLMLRYGVE